MHDCDHLEFFLSGGVQHIERKAPHGPAPYLAPYLCTRSWCLVRTRNSLFDFKEKRASETKCLLIIERGCREHFFFGKAMERYLPHAKRARASANTSAAGRVAALPESISARRRSASCIHAASISSSSSKLAMSNSASFARWSLGSCITSISSSSILITHLPCYKDAFTIIVARCRRHVQTPCPMPPFFADLIWVDNSLQWHGQPTSAFPPTPATPPQSALATHHALLWRTGARWQASGRVGSAIRAERDIRLVPTHSAEAHGRAGTDRCCQRSRS
jgi:hypothetical protein